MAITKTHRMPIYLLLCGFVACTQQRIHPEPEPKSTHHEEKPVLVENTIAAKAEEKPPVISREKPTEPFTIVDEQGRPIEVYPPISDEKRAPIVVLLHATCMQPAWVCNWFGSAGRDPGWLICPSGNSTCAGEPDWHGPGPEKAAFLEDALEKVEANVADWVAEEPGVLIGWSRGAFAARDILYTAIENPESFPHAKRFRGLVLMAAAMKPDVAKLKEAGIKRVVMAAGDFDGSKSTMVSAVVALQAGGIEARYVSLGKIAHVWPNDFENRMREPISWAAQAPQ
jgi:predicted esterase